MVAAVGDGAVARVGGGGGEPAVIEGVDVTAGAARTAATHAATSVSSSATVARTAARAGRVRVVQRADMRRSLPSCLSPSLPASEHPGGTARQS